MKTPKIITIFFKLLGLPFMLGLLMVIHSFIILKQLTAYVFFGGETIFYRKGEKDMINDCYLKLLEIQEQQSRNHAT